MELKEAVINRRSIRKYQQKDVPLQAIAEILETARFAPSAGNAQNWRLVIVTDKKKKSEISEFCHSQHWMTDAPAFIVMCNASKKLTTLYKESGKMFSTQNCAIIASYIQLLAVENGLGTCWVGAFEHEKVHRLLNIDDDVSVEAIITIGYPDEEKHSHVRNEFVNFCYFDKWGNKQGSGHGFSVKEKAKSGLAAFKGLFSK
ncbi:MAG: nitroreductase family protein [Candidatus Woesearchaeota archaeon]|nr:nitroreductase family protein [Nanoarchaeota archaeon]